MTEFFRKQNGIYTKLEIRRGSYYEQLGSEAISPEGGVPIKSLEISTRTKNSLMREGIETVEQVTDFIAKRGFRELLKFPEIGKCAVNEVMKALGLHKKTVIDESRRTIEEVIYNMRRISDHLKDLEARVAETEKQRDELLEAIKVLLLAKDEKDQHGDNPVYRTLKNKGWALARAAIIKATGEPT